MSENLFEILRGRFPADLGQPAMVPPEGRHTSYGDLLAISGRMASLLASLGVTKGERVAVIVEKSPEAICLYLACLRAGAIYLPLNTAYRPAELAYFLGDAAPKVVVGRPSEAAGLKALCEACGARLLTLGEAGDGTLLSESRHLDTEFDTLSAGADDLAALLYTSGTTGRSKGAMLSHGNLASNAVALHRIWGFRPGDVLLHALPIFHTHGLFVATNCALLNGSKMFFLPRFDAEQILRILPDCSVMMGVPTFYTRLLARPDFAAETCRSMRLFISGSAPLLEETFAAFQERTGHTILERYGMTETGMNTSNPLEGERRAGTVGFPLPDVTVRIADEGGRLLPSGEAGVLEVKGPNVFKGYWRQPDKTAAEFRADGYFITGDVARIDEGGRVRIVGRAKDLIISGGFNVYPKEVELVIDAVEGVVESAVIGLAHPDFGEAVAAVVKRAVPAGGPDEAAILAAAKAQLAGYKVPKRVFFVEELPRNAMGKVQKNLLREQYKDSF